MTFAFVTDAVAFQFVRTSALGEPASSGEQIDRAGHIDGESAVAVGDSQFAVSCGAITTTRSFDRLDAQVANGAA